MKNANVTSRLARLLALPLLVLALVACDNPVEDGDHPEGLVVLNASGAEVARFTVGDDVAAGTLNVGLEGSTAFTVHAISDEGDRIEIDGDELSIQVGDVRPGVTASVVGVNQVVLTATSAGQSPLTITLFHEDHPEFAAAFQVTAG